MEDQAEIERIDAGVRRIRYPLYFSDQFYHLRLHTANSAARAEMRLPPSFTSVSRPKTSAAREGLPGA